MCACVLLRIMLMGAWYRSRYTARYPLCHFCPRSSRVSSSPPMRSKTIKLNLFRAVSARQLPARFEVYFNCNLRAAHSIVFCPILLCIHTHTHTHSASISLGVLQSAARAVLFVSTRAIAQVGKENANSGYAGVVLDDCNFHE